MKIILHRGARVGAALIALALASASLAQKAPEAYELLEQPAFKSAYLAALGPKAKTRWLAKRDGPAPLPSYQQVAGERYVMNSFCKNHDCEDNSAVVLYSPDKRIVYGIVHEKGGDASIGNPPPDVAQALRGLWKKEWRSRPG